MPRAFILVMDSFGIGAAPDAASFGDAGADTLGHIALACAQGRADKPGIRSGPLRLPTLARWGLGEAARLATGTLPPGLEAQRIEGAYAAAAELSRGKDTPSGHWEIAGQPVTFEWGYFPRGDKAFPEDRIAALVARGNIPGILGDCHASGTEIIDRLGEEHLRSGKPICYTSADSVFQIAAHEEVFGLQRLYDLCLLAKEIFDPLNIARVIARPFVGARAGAFSRTANRRDYTTPPPGPTLLDHAAQDKREVISVGKIADIFAHCSTGENLKAANNDGLFARTLEGAARLEDGGLLFANFVDFDMLYGHRRDIAGYAAALEQFDRQLAAFERQMKPGDLALITADHGCDPSWPGSDHTREFVPALFFGEAAATRGALGRRESFADMGQTLARHLSLAPLATGTACF
ncbi:MAG TPA: phosphopentomutase [Dongiaceae bacterium]|jgi:phosphopentomutase|nr:phosphopentomutase [Dongiaceae bacterium]